MAKGNQKYQRDAINSEQGASDKRYNDFGNMMSSQTPGLQDQAAKERGQLNQGYTGFANDGGFSDAEADKVRQAYGGIGGGGGMTYNPLQSRVAGFNLPSRGAARGTAGELSTTGGVDINKLESSLPGYQKMHETGGYDAASEKTLGDISSRLMDHSRYGSKDADNLRQFAKTGGVNEQDRANIFRPLYGEMERTGGYSDQDRQNLRDRSNSGVESFYQNLKDDQDKQRAATGATGPGAAAINFKLARQAAQQGGDQALKTETDMKQHILDNQMKGADATTAAQLKLTGITSPAMEAAMMHAGQLTNQSTQNENSGLVDAGNITDRTQATKANNRLGALKGITDTNRGAQELVQRGKNMGMQGNISMDDSEGSQGLQKAGMEDTFNQRERDAANAVAAHNAGAGASGRAASAAAEAQILAMRQHGREFGMGGLSDTYTHTNAPLSENYKYWNDNINNQSHSGQGNRSLQLQNDEVNRSHLAQNIIGGIGAAGGIMGGMGGFGAVGAGRKLAGRAMSSVGSQVGASMGGGW